MSLIKHDNYSTEHNFDLKTSENSTDSSLKKNIQKLRTLDVELNEI